jgi:hypothetical protein
MMTVNTKPVDIVIPIYKASFDVEEKFAIDQSFAVLSAYPIVFVAPQGLDISFYTTAYPNATFIYFEERYFKSVNDYSRLLVSDEFYEAFESEFLLIVQPDVYLFHDDLPYWINSPFDYVGAPWPNGLSLNIKFGKFDLGGAGTPITVYVGNGGLSLRRRKKCMALITEHREIADWFIRSGSNEDLFFAFMGALSADFVIPNQITASLFALEVSPERFYTINGEKLPMGVHRYRDYSSDFWKPRIPSPGLLQHA